VTVHWGIPDPAAVEGTEADRRAAFRRAYDALERRVKAFMDLPIESLDRAQLENRLREIAIR
jgi:arsenate reductase